MRKQINRKTLAMGAFCALAWTASIAQAAVVQGFRSASFGADESAVIAAASKDLGVPASEIKHRDDPVAKVAVLSVKLNEFAPLNVPATVNYILGHKCHCLMQVQVQWELGPDLVAQRRAAAWAGTSALAQRFESLSWDKSETVVNQLLGQPKDGAEVPMLLFRGQNKQGGAITLMASPVKLSSAAAAKPADGAPPAGYAANVDHVNSVSVVYERDATNPDVVHIDANGF
jgi:hypothetical protein